MAPGPSALVLARQAYEEAARAAARHAAAGAALCAVTAEANATRRRVRALRHHWIPVLGEALAALATGTRRAGTRGSGAPEGRAGHTFLIRQNTRVILGNLFSFRVSSDYQVVELFLRFAVVMPGA
ncbi:V-type ATP synthase subunit D [Amycolatopsis pigmentata]|uniref:V-type ATP synthase subunit D n=1 Tax=Amycolatopsis pigmentata TaxID=450801 RepID=A0ABW5FSZ0_9PSEU